MNRGLRFYCLLAGAALGVFCFDARAFAAEGVNIGDACSPAGSLTHQNDATGATDLVCDGAAWQQGIRYDKSGKIGLGTVTPGSALDVKGTLRLSGATSGYVGLAPAAAAGSTTYTLPSADGSSGYQLTTDGAGNLSWSSAAGAGGIPWSSLTAPTGNLALSMAANTSTFTYNAATGASDLFKLTDTASNTGTGYLVNIATAASSTEKPFHVGAAGTDAITVLANGNVGIGTATPITPLQVVGHITGDSIGYNNNTKGYIKFSTGKTDLFPSSGYDTGVVSTSTSIDLSIQGTSIQGGVGGGTATLIVNRNDAASTTFQVTVWQYGGSELVRITGGGNVGIGTTSPIAGLDVEKAIAAASGLAYGSLFQQTLTAAANNDILTALYINPTFADAGKTGVSHNGLIVGSGNVGFGTTSPSYRLHVIGTGTSGTGSIIPLSLRGTSAANAYDVGIQFEKSDGTALWEVGSSLQSGTVQEFAIYDMLAGTSRLLINSSGNVGIGTTTPQAKLDVVGNINYSGVIEDVSDRRFKKDIRSLPPGALEKILKLQPVSFVMKQGDGTTELGFIAQDVEPLFPVLVNPRPDGMRTMNYIGLIPPVVEAIQEQHSEVDALKAEVNALKAETKALKARLDALEIRRDPAHPDRYNQ